MTDDEQATSQRHRGWCEDGEHDFSDAPDPLRQVCSACPTWQWRPGCSPRELHAQVIALSARLAEVQKFRDEAFSAGVEAVFDQVEDITHGNYDAETFRRRFHQTLGLEASPREVVPACPQCACRFAPDSRDELSGTPAWYCSCCEQHFIEPAYWQRVSKP